MQCGIDLNGSLVLFSSFMCHKSLLVLWFWESTIIVNTFQVCLTETLQGTPISSRFPFVSCHLVSQSQLINLWISHLAMPYWATLCSLFMCMMQSYDLFLILCFLFSWSLKHWSCYINCDSNNWHFCANLSSGILLIWDGDLAYIDDVQKPNSLATPSWLWPRVMVFSYQLLRYWQSCVSSKWASVDTCQLLKDNGGVSSRKRDSGTVLSSSSEKASRSRRPWSEQKDDQHIDWCRSRLRYMTRRSPL